MYDTTLGWPSVVLDASSWTYGEVYEVNEHTLRQLDELEGYHGPDGDNDYDRVTVSVEAGDRTVEALVYVYTAAQVVDLPEVLDGDWSLARLNADHDARR